MERAERRLKLIIEYDGTDFSGWQLQPNARTVQGELERAFDEVAAAAGGSTPIRVTGAGRTDAGVHALGQVAHLDTDAPLPDDGLLKAVNARLPQDVRLASVEQVPDDFHARFSALSRTYRYRILRRESVLQRRYTWAVGYGLDYDLMAQAARIIVGRHSFKSFSRARPGEKDYICNVMQADWTYDDERATFRVTADRFMHAMVRGLVGALVDLGRGYYALDDFRRLVEHPEKVGAVHTAPARGLVLVGVGYTLNNVE